MKYDIIGDVHGCYYELEKLLQKLGYVWRDDVKCYYYPDNSRQIVYVGDLIDRGPHSSKVLRLVMNQVKYGAALMCMGNHDDKYMRYLMGQKVKFSEDLQKTIDQVKRDLDEEEVKYFLKERSFLFHLLDEGKLVVAHAGWHKSLKKPTDYRNRAWCLYGPSLGVKKNGFPERVDWVQYRLLIDRITLYDKTFVREPPPYIVYGHQPYKEARIEKRTIGIDTGCVFGGKLSALRYPEMDVVSVKSFDKYAESLGWGYSPLEINIGDVVEVNLAMHHDKDSNQHKYIGYIVGGEIDPHSGKFYYKIKCPNKEGIFIIVKLSKKSLKLLNTK